MVQKSIPDDFQKLLDSVTNKRARFVIDTILEKGSCSTEDLKCAGYEHAPRAARDVRELGIPLETKKGKDSDGKQMAVYVFGDWEEARKQNSLSKTSGRTQLTENLKKKLIARYGCKCYLYGEEYPERLLQPDHRIPYEIGGDPEDMMDTDYFMLLCPSANRDKSWACEHCINWTEKDVNFCKKCYYAYPEQYEHIAGVQERRVDIVFAGEDIALYEDIALSAKKDNVSTQDAIKRLLAYAKELDN
ncbi:MAG: HNH endonuclease [Bacteroides thetaiotaomicron]|nr:HNH endonuclease [Bacteroides thetaiotaomicron]